MPSPCMSLLILPILRKMSLSRDPAPCRTRSTRQPSQSFLDGILTYFVGTSLAIRRRRHWVLQNLRQFSEVGGMKSAVMAGEWVVSKLVCDGWKLGSQPQREGALIPWTVTSPAQDYRNKARQEQNQGGCGGKQSIREHGERERAARVLLARSSSLSALHSFEIGCSPVGLLG